MTRGCGRKADAPPSLRQNSITSARWPRELGNHPVSFFYNQFFSLLFAKTFVWGQLLCEDCQVAESSSC